MSSSLSRRSFVQLLASSAAVSLPIMTEGRLARAQRIRKEIHPDANAVLIDANENPLGPSAGARAAAVDMVAQGGRYHASLADELTHLFASQQGLKPEYVDVYPGSSEPLHYAVLAFTSASRSYVAADPTYEAGSFAAAVSGARVIPVPLAKETYAHDVRAMVAADPHAGLLYICTPNNPTGSVTPHNDIAWAADNRPAGSILLVDEAYIHFSQAESAIDLVKADKDVIVLRTFSKIYGMAGLRCGFAIGRPDLLKKLRAYCGWNSMPITAVAAAMNSLQDASLVSERRRINSESRAQTFEWLAKRNYTFVPSESNCFMLDTRRPAHAVIDAMAAQDIYIGRVWPAWPTFARVTVGTPAEMSRFENALAIAMQQTAALEGTASGLAGATRHLPLSSPLNIRG